MFFLFKWFLRSLYGTLSRSFERVLVGWVVCCSKSRYESGWKACSLDESEKKRILGVHRICKVLKLKAALKTS